MFFNCITIFLHKTYRWNYSNNVQVPQALRKKICFTLAGFWTRALPYGYWCRQSTKLQIWIRILLICVKGRGLWKANAILSSTNNTWGWARFLPYSYMIRIWVTLNVPAILGNCYVGNRTFANSRITSDWGSSSGMRLRYTSTEVILYFYTFVPTKKWVFPTFIPRGMNLPYYHPTRNRLPYCHPIR